MEATTVAPDFGGLRDLTVSELLGAARQRRSVVQRGEADLLAIAYEWAVAHPADPDGWNAASFHHPLGEEPISGDGTPRVAEFCIPELGAALGISTDAAKKLIGHAIEMVHRLPRVWRRVQSGTVPVWRAKQVAEATIHCDPALTPEAMAWIDAQVAPFLEKVGRAQMERIVAQAIELYGLAAQEPPLDEDNDGRYVHIHTPIGPFAGSMHLEAEVSNADGHDLAQALSAGAAAIKAGGSTASLDVRRSMALGELARQQTSLDLAGANTVPTSDDVGAGSAGSVDTAAGTAAGTTGSACEPVQRKARRVDLHLHFTAEVQPDGTTGISPIGFLENGQKLALLSQVRSWVRGTHTEVRILPVIDLNEHITTSRYEPTDRLRRQVILRDRTCVFPWCTRPARSCDLDHVEPFDHDAIGEDRPPPGSTATHNLAPLCRSHHRLKTHTGWRLTSPTSGVFEWTSPHGQRFRRDRHGTQDLTQGPDGEPPPAPSPPRPRV
ncbi:HNH endonuclease [Nocardioides sp. Y6]|uniref:HNH endonuclease n=1 Tax=Nocardioides malaquae TaxID=2773426 RepID=A0ABR9RWI9_9ACTN|nr:HNH endonuclease signature motif containing protein [Nocardioides malaquae]MBE7325919.1 HNH endonuclease [Nocardioides malaquae]